MEDKTMRITLATAEQIANVQKYDRHIEPERLADCLRQNRVYALYDGEQIIGVLRYSLFWQHIRFVDLLYIDEDYQNRGWGRAMMAQFEQDMKHAGFLYVMLSTQADETAKFFYEKLGYHLAGAFLPPEQEADELIYWKSV